MQTRNNKVIRWLLTLVFLFGMLAGVSTMSATAFAEDTVQFGIRPSNSDPTNSTRGYFILKGQTSQILRDAVVVANPGKVAVTLELYPVDAITSSHSGASYLTMDAPRAGVASWIKLDSNEVELLPQKQITVGFTVTVPQNIQPGQHLGGIAVQPKKIEGSGKTPVANMGVTTVTRAITAVQVNVAGANDTPSLRITGAQIEQAEGLPTLTLSLQNEGNIMIKPTGTVTLTDATGKTVLNQKLSLDTFLPRNNITYPVEADPPDQSGTYRVRASLDYGASAPAVFDGEVMVKAQVVSTEPVTGGRARPGLATPVANAIGIVSIQGSTEDGSPLLLILLVVSGMLLLITVGLSVVVLRSRRHQAK